MNIIQAINEPRVIGDFLSPAQASLIKSIYRLPLGALEPEVENGLHDNFLGCGRNLFGARYASRNLAGGNSGLGAVYQARFSGSARVKRQQISSPGGRLRCRRGAFSGLFLLRTRGGFGPACFLVHSCPFPLLEFHTAR